MLSDTPRQLAKSFIGNDAYGNKATWQDRITATENFTSFSAFLF